jgi:hypothetical protein
MYQSQKPVKDEAYLRFIRRLFCLVCGQSHSIEACHTGPRGLGQKSSDRSALPLCRKHHRTANDSLHSLGPVEFASHHQLDIPAAIERMNQFYDERLARRA